MKAVVHDRPCSLRELALRDLLVRIVHQSDRDALNEFHERTVFLADGRRLRFVEFIQWLGGRDELALAWKRSPVTLEITLDILTDKFSRLPAAPALKHDGPDVRFYLGACLRFLETDPVMLGAQDPLIRELRTAEVLQNLVKRHFVFSAFEARRRIHPSVRRFCWQENGRSLYFWLPKEMTADECRRWLSDRLSGFPPGASNLRECIQERINSELWLPRILSASDEAVEATIRSPDIPAIWSLEREISVKGLAEVVAQEKAEHLAHQRPAIQMLGPKRLKQMVLRIFEDLASGWYSEVEIARAFGLSKPSFSRFAGSRWNRRIGNGVKVPDLWRNTAQTLSRHRSFLQSAKDAGVWPNVEAVLAQQENGGDNDNA